VDLKIDFSEWFKKQNRFFRIGFAKFTAEYLGYSGYGAYVVHTEKINDLFYVYTKIHLVLQSYACQLKTKRHKGLQ